MDECYFCHCYIYFHAEQHVCALRLNHLQDYFYFISYFERPPLSVQYYKGQRFIDKKQPLACQR